MIMSMWESMTPKKKPWGKKLMVPCAGMHVCIQHLFICATQFLFWYYISYLVLLPPYIVILSIYKSLEIHSSPQSATISALLFKPLPQFQKKLYGVLWSTLNYTPQPQICCNIQHEIWLCVVCVVREIPKELYGFVFVREIPRELYGYQSTCRKV